MRRRTDNYATHVCNYYCVRILEWFRELPVILQDKKWCLIQRRPRGDLEMRIQPPLHRGSLFLKKAWLGASRLAACWPGYLVEAEVTYLR